METPTMAAKQTEEVRESRAGRKPRQKIPTEGNRTLRGTVAKELYAQVEAIVESLGTDNGRWLRSIALASLAGEPVKNRKFNHDLTGTKTLRCRISNKDYWRAVERAEQEGLTTGKWLTMIAQDEVTRLKKLKKAS